LAAEDTEFSGGEEEAMKAEAGSEPEKVPSEAGSDSVMQRMAVKQRLVE
jgi:hypothetical protein